MNDASQVYDIVIIGGGPAGLTAAIAVAESGAKTALLARRAPYGDNRTTALLGASTDLLEHLDVWRRCSDKAAALQTMRLVDDTGRLIRAPEVRFSSEEIGLDQFGYNIDNHSLMAALWERVAELAGLTRFDDEAETIRPEDADVTIHTRQGQSLTARLVIGADGRQSPSREAAGIVSDARAMGEDPGAPSVLQRYHQARRADVASRTFVIDLANRSLLSDFLPMQSLRAAGLHLIGSIGPLRRLAMREGLAPSWKRVS